MAVTAGPTVLSVLKEAAVRMSHDAHIQTHVNALSRTYLPDQALTNPPSLVSADFFLEIGSILALRLHLRFRTDGSGMRHEENA